MIYSICVEPHFARNIAVGSTVTACGEESSGSSRKTRKPASVKQEPTGKTFGLA